MAISRIGRLKLSAIAALVGYFIGYLDCLLLPRDLAIYRHRLPKGRQAVARRKVYTKNSFIHKGQNPLYIMYMA